MITIDSQEDFDTNVLQAKLPVVVDFWAPWCGPCRQIAPLLEEASASYLGRVIIAKVNVDESQALATRYGVRSIPTLIAFSSGKLQTTLVGSTGRSHLFQWIDKVANA